MLEKINRSHEFVLELWESYDFDNLFSFIRIFLQGKFTNSTKEESLILSENSMPNIPESLKFYQNFWIEVFASANSGKILQILWLQIAVTKNLWTGEI